MLFPDVRPPEIVDGDQRFTLRETDVWCRARAGVDAWDLDVAACEESHLAERYFTKAQDGLRQPWAGRVWCNPPFSDIEPWVEKAWKEITTRDGPAVIAMLLPASRTEQAWWQALVEPFRDQKSPAALPLCANTGLGMRWADLSAHFLPSRTRFGLPGNPKGIGVGSPPFGCVLLVWRRA